ncbi:hypothetical protein [Endomicrobium proavitum]|uniref:PemK-like protein n=1 Tax=Endomicrobium proavitum TaxID=1408281 RepID=A0A0G3WHD8_9BACT|nr:hypothetical protein [Endomicrobium proavitum]AKL98041.1 hypothetical protein Epro_0662 [Endomicrobium proavitum]
MKSAIVKGKAFWEVDRSGVKHLYFVLSEPNIDDRVLVVNITDASGVPAGRDKSCVLNLGEHPAITKKSVAYYFRAIELNASAIISEINKKGINQVEDLSESTLKKIQDGAKRSPLLPNKLKKYFDNF